MLKNVILTGATGFIGRYLLKQLIEDGFYVTTLIRSKDKEKELLEFLRRDNDFTEDKLTFIEASLEEIENIVFPEKNYFAWIQLAWGGVNRDEINNEKVHKKNYDYSIKCLHKAKELNCEKFIEAGSRAECGNEDSTIPEAMSGNPLNVYGKYKRLFYEFAFDFCKNNNIEYLHLRLFAVTGPGDHPWSLVSECCRRFCDNEPMHFGSCEQMWNYLDVRDVARIIVSLLDKYNYSLNDNCIINVANLNSKQLKEYIYSIYELTQSASELAFSDKKGFDSNPIVDKLIDFYDFSTNYIFKDTIKDILEIGF
jgi:nucleoside-diphosphate-sugar epimerase